MTSAPTEINKVADWFINRVDRDAGETITHLKLQKLLYYAQAWYLANKGKPMFEEDFQAWAHGPVSRKIYDRFVGQSWSPIEPVKKTPSFPDDVRKCLERVFEEYGKYGAKYLENLTHKQAPWKDARGSLAPESRCETVIAKDMMRDYYGARIDKVWK